MSSAKTVVTVHHAQLISARRVIVLFTHVTTGGATMYADVVDPHQADDTTRAALCPQTSSVSAAQRTPSEYGEAEVVTTHLRHCTATCLRTRPAFNTQLSR